MIPYKLNGNSTCKKTHLVLGGAKSGKSRLALSLAERYPAPRLFIATAEALDEEMVRKIEIHKAERGEGWYTIEEPLAISSVIRDEGKNFSVLLLDCITLWVTNLILKQDPNPEDFHKWLSDLTDAIKSSERSVVIVSNEVGMGIVPDSSIGRKFREYAGEANQRIAAVVDEVSLCVAGFPVTLKSPETI